GRRPLARRPRNRASAARRHEQPAPAEALRRACRARAGGPGGRVSPPARRAHRARDGRRLASRSGAPPPPKKAATVSFDYPVPLLALAFVPLSALIYAAAQRRRRRFAVRFTNMDLLADVVTETPSWRRHIPPALFMLALAALAISIARPHELVSVAKREAT